MMFPVIRVYDKDNGDTHIVGTDSHDSLHIDDDGQLSYYNMQNGCGTGETYSFVAAENEWDICPSVEFVTFDQLLDIIREHAGLSAERERKMRGMMARIWKDFDDEVERSVEQGLRHS